MNFDEILILLSKVPLFSGVSLEHLSRHLGHANHKQFVAGETILAPGRENTCIYVVLSGRLRVHTGSPGNEPVAVFGACESIGEMSILFEGASTVFLLADTDSTLLNIEHAMIWGLVNDSHAAAINLLNILAMRSSSKRASFNDTEKQLGYVGLDHVDELTGLFNIKWMYEIFSRQIYRCSVNQSRATMMMVSIDSFTQYNNDHGCLGGDQALRTVAQTILSCLRPNDQAVRFKGKLFLTFLPNTPLGDGRLAAKRLLEEIGKAHIVTPGGDELPGVTASIGLAEVDEHSSLEHILVQIADAVQRARDAGRNCISE